GNAYCKPLIVNWFTLIVIAPVESRPLCAATMVLDEAPTTTKLLPFSEMSATSAEFAALRAVIALLFGRPRTPDWPGLVPTRIMPDASTMIELPSADPPVHLGSVPVVPDPLTEPPPPASGCQLRVPAPSVERMSPLLPSAAGRT